MTTKRKRRPSGNCQKCSTWRYSLHREHIVPRWKGGSDEPENIQWLCANCHEDKTREDLKGFSKPVPAHVRQKISATLKGRTFTPEHLANLQANADARRGVPRSDAHRAALSKALRGKKLNLSPEQRAARAARAMRPMSAETKAAISAGVLRRRRAAGREVASC